MKSKMKSDLVWIVEIPDSSSCTGQSVSTMLHELQSHTSCSELLIYGIQQEHSRLVMQPNVWTSLSVNDAVKWIAAIPQIDWAFFFFLNSRTEIGTIKSATSFQEAIGLVPVTMQVADFSYFFVFTASEPIARAISLKVPHSKVTSGTLNDLRLMY